MGKFLLLIIIPLTLFPNKYDRKQFGGWIDEDGDCQKTRAEELIDHSKISVTLTPDTCRVLSGKWIDPYTGISYTNASSLDIDHVVPLAEAWREGADKWTTSERVKFANDPENLIPVGKSINRSKGSKHPGKWLPTKDPCGYVEMWNKVRAKYMSGGITYGCFKNQETDSILY